MAPGAADDIIIAQWNDLEALEAVFKANPDEIACVMMEPIMGNTNCIVADDGYLQGALDLCEKYGALLIFDEVITGFRVAHGGAQEFSGVVPHIATYGKSVAGGFPLSVLVGLPEIMEKVGSGEIQHGGSFNSNVMVMSALAISRRIPKASTTTSMDAERDSCRGLAPPPKKLASPCSCRASEPRSGPRSPSETP